jgi:hypothetical protein
MGVLNMAGESYLINNQGIFVTDDSDLLGRNTGVSSLHERPACGRNASPLAPSYSVDCLILKGQLGVWPDAQGRVSS